MTEAEDKAKAEKLAAAKKRVAQLQKQKAKKAGEKKKDEVDTKTPDQATDSTAPNREEDPVEQEPAVEEPKETPAEQESDEAADTPSKPSHGRQPSLSVQSKMRSSSFRRSSLSLQNVDSPTTAAKSPTLPPLSPEGGTMPDIYRKQAIRIEELERENKRLEKEARDGESRWRKSEEELEDLREGNTEVVELKARVSRAEKKSEEADKLKLEVTSLQRQISQLQSTKSLRSPSNPSAPIISSSPDSLAQQLSSKSTTIEAMELEISNLRARMSSQSTNCATHSEQISALEQKAFRAEAALDKAQRELADTKHSLSRAAEKAMKEGVDKTSSDTKMKSLEREVQEASAAKAEADKRISTLEKKLAALSNLQKENEARTAVKLKESEHAEKDVEMLRKRVAGMDNEIMRLREERDRHRKREISAPGEDGLDELEDEERVRLEKKVRELEGEVYDLRRGVWKERRKEYVDRHEDDEAVKTPGSAFDEVDLTGGFSPSRRRSSAARPGQGFTNVLSSGWGALTGGGRQGSLDLLDDDGDDNFNEDAFRIAQEEEEARQRVEWVREQKRKLRDWDGWRVDLVELRKGVSGAGEVFDI